MISNRPSKWKLLRQRIVHWTEKARRANRLFFFRLLFIRSFNVKQKKCREKQSKFFCWSDFSFAIDWSICEKFRFLLFDSTYFDVQHSVNVKPIGTMSLKINECEISAFRRWTKCAHLRHWCCSHNNLPFLTALVFDVRYKRCQFKFRIVWNVKEREHILATAFFRSEKPFLTERHAFKWKVIELVFIDKIELWMFFD